MINNITMHLDLDPRCLGLGLPRPQGPVLEVWEDSLDSALGIQFDHPVQLAGPHFLLGKIGLVSP